MAGGGLTGPADLTGFRELQQLAYAAAQSVAGSLEPGVTEKQAARRIREYLLEAGVQDWFHTPFAWFGDRTAFRGFRIPLQFFPTNRRLEEGMPFILDCARAYCTLFEIRAAMEDVFGAYKEPVFF